MNKKYMKPAIEEIAIVLESNILNDSTVGMSSTDITSENSSDFVME